MGMCRPIRKHCASIAFCCQSHLQRCRSSSDFLAVDARGGREPLDVVQMADFVSELVKGGPVWPAVLLLTQLFLGERADAARLACIGWFHNIEPSAVGAPCVKVPKVNGKTTARELPLPCEFATKLHPWMHMEPLKNPNHQWPFLGQDVQSSGALLFPGQARNRSRQWARAITERSYLKMLKDVAARIGQERTVARLAGTKHTFDGVSLDRIGTHSINKSFVSALKNAKYSTAVISALTGTTPRTLDSTYDIPTTQRQRSAVQDVIVPVLPGFAAGATAALPARYCPSCGTQRQVASWAFCPQCGQRFAQ